MRPSTDGGPNSADLAGFDYSRAVCVCVCDYIRKCVCVCQDKSVAAMCCCCCSPQVCACVRERLKADKRVSSCRFPNNKRQTTQNANIRLELKNTHVNTHTMWTRKMLQTKQRKMNGLLACTALNLSVATPRVGSCVRELEHQQHAVFPRRCCCCCCCGS